MFIGAFSFTGKVITDDLYAPFQNKIVNDDIHWSANHYSELLHLTFYKSNNAKRIDDHQVYLDEDVVVFIIGYLFDQNSNNHSESAERIASIYKNQGLNGVFDIEGEYVIGIFDKQKNDFYLIRDHLGCVPVAYIVDESILYFGSELMKICAFFRGNQPLDKDYLMSRFFTYESTYQYTPHADLIKIEPATFVKFSDSSVETNIYWNPISNETVSYSSKNHIIDTIESMLHNAIQQRLQCYHKVSSHLSGGLDSTLITIMAKKIAPDRLNVAFSWSPENSELSTKIYDERKVILDEAKKHDFKVQFHSSLEEDYKNYINNWTHPTEIHYEKFTAYSCRNNNIECILSGFGGDEFIGPPNIPFYRQTLSHFDCRRFLQIQYEKNLKGYIKSFLFDVLFPRKRRPFYSLKTSESFFKLLQLKSNKASSRYTKSFLSKNGYFEEMRSYLHLPERMDDWYILAQQNGYNYHYPLLSKKLIEFLYQLDYKYFIGNETDRILIRKLAARHLSKNIYELEKNADPVRQKRLHEVEEKIANELNLEFLNNLEPQLLSLIELDELKKITQNKNTSSFPTGFLLFLYRTNELKRQYCAF